MRRLSSDMIRVHVGSTNATKVEAVRDAFGAIERFADAHIVGVSVPVDVYGHPKSLDEVIGGAKMRAEHARGEAAYGVGIEGGLMAVPGTKTGYMEVAACAIYDGTAHALGLSPGYEWPTDVLEKILNDGMDGSQALRAAGLTTEEKVGTGKGGLGILTRDRVDRRLYNRLAVQMALMQIEFPDFYRTRAADVLDR